MLPAVAQGAIGIEIRAGDDKTAHLIAPLNDEQTAICITAERAFLAKLEGSCRTPIAGLAQLQDGQLGFRGQLLSVSGETCLQSSAKGQPRQALDLGVEAAEAILAQGGATLNAALMAS